MEDIFTFGPLMLKRSWLILAVSLASGYLFFHFYLRNNSELREKIKTLLWNALFCFLLTWKLSPALFRLSVFINDPILLIYYMPGNKESLLALIITLIFIMYQIFRLNLSFYPVFNAIFLIYVEAAFVFYFFTEEQGNRVEWDWLVAMLSHHPLHIYYMTLFLLGTIWGVYTKYGFHSHLLFRSYLSLICVGQAGIYFFKPYPYVLGIQANIFWLFVLITGLVLELFYTFFSKNKVQHYEDGRLI